MKFCSAKNRLIFVLIILALASSRVDTSAKNKPDHVVVERGSIRIEAAVVDGSLLEEKISARSDAVWVELAVSEGKSVGAVSFIDKN